MYELRPSQSPATTQACIFLLRFGDLIFRLQLAFSPSVVSDNFTYLGVEKAGAFL